MLMGRIVIHQENDKNTNSLDLTKKSPKVGTNSNGLMESPIVDLRIKLGSEVILLCFGAKQL